MIRKGIEFFKTHSFHSLAFPISMAILVGACGKLPGFQVLAKSDSFSQTVQVNDKIDLLFVVDNSGSMSEEQAVLANSFQTFISQFLEKNLNFQIGVISTDVTNNPNYWAATGAYTNSIYRFFPNAGPGTLLARGTNEKILRPDTLNLAEKFQQNITLTTSGSGNEAGVLSAHYALDPARLDACGWNEGFIRPEALLAIVFLSDEDESRAISSTLKDKYIRDYPTEKAERLAAFSQRLDSLKPDRPDLIRVDAIVAPSVAQCPTVYQNGTGDVYSEVALGRNGNVSNICTDFAPALSELGADLIQMLSRFQLKQKPDGSLEVYVDSRKIPEDPVNGWRYLPETKDVEFRGSEIPKADAKISIKYVPAEPLR